MKKSVKYILLLVLSLSIGILLYKFTPQNSKDSGVLIVGISPDNPPFTYNRGGQYYGADVDLMNEIAQRLKKEIVYTSMEFDSLIPMLMSGEIDIAISSIAITEKRSKKVDFTIPYFRDNFVVLYKDNFLQKTISKSTELVSEDGEVVASFKLTTNFSVSEMINSDEEIIALAEINKIGVQSGSEMEEYLNTVVDRSNILTLSNLLHLITTLMHRDIGCILMDSTVGAQSLQQYYPSIRYAIVSMAPKNFAIALKQGSKLRNDINRVIKELEHEEFIQKAIQKHLM